MMQLKRGCLLAQTKHISKPNTHKIRRGVSFLLVVMLTCLVSVPETGFSQARSQAKSKQSVKKKKKLGGTRTKILKDKTRKKEGHEAGTGVAIFMGMTGGQLSIQTDDPSVESNKSGLYLAGKALSSFYTKNWVFDLGLGWFYGEAGAQEPGTAEVPPDSEPVPVQIGLNAGLFEFAPRFRITQNWQIGPVFDGFFSTEDVAFNGIYAEQDSPSPFAGLIGAQIMYGVPKKQADWRAGIEYLTDITIEGRQLHIISGTLQFGLPLVSPDTIYRDKVVVTEHRSTEVTERRKVKKRVVVKEVVKYVFESKQILFIGDGTLLHPDSQSFLLELSQILQNNSDLWDELKIEGHVNDTTPFQQQKRVSAKRAFAVRAALVGGGIPANKVSSVGFGTSKPIRPNWPSERDERIVLSFSGITDMRALGSAVNKIRKQFHIPETCTDEGCR